MLTAGHCHDGRYYHNGAFIGTATVNSLDGGTTVNSDSLRIPRSSTSPMNLIFVTEEAPAVYGRSIGAYRPTSQQLMGNAVCKSGRTTWYDCGTITSANFNYSISHEGRVFTIIGGKLASTIVNPGDSGGPVFYGSTAYGIMSARTSNGSLAYTGVEQAMSTLGIRLCLNSACS